MTTDLPALRERLLGEMVGSYLYCDILEMEGVRRSDKIVDLLRLLAFRIGQEISVAEIAASLALNRQTYEFTWQSGEIRPATRNEFLSAYPGSELMTVRQDNFEDFLM